MHNPEVFIKLPVPIAKIRGLNKYRKLLRTREVSATNGMSFLKFLIFITPLKLAVRNGIPITTKLLNSFLIISGVRAEASKESIAANLLLLILFGSKPRVDHLT